ncbi:TPA: hypothetical protein DDW69_03915 [candidate division CPR2 bacterium]|uniref:L,D-TPase catalytic domain-containing protein n=1 Tax=candidate division CPR2 bacterium GW2011_GWC1_41_48 TaxID=1618344 RepID=A0A0G0Z7F0_UNCC2|nr:MAG: hypothetical protein UT47_C0003G0029 [candidate division CPR2 bacterium GW2011_GWC2_39_35]KKR27424.1 MAG: hypothetical protein UT59_C0057G0005 [candidate division CPR2 bacterium GW2011_GWD1_39_7]KKR28603.1 MAG: hypothetical protein UT60_C0016G0003 [candidate division CPR2 bacterium GW2011_GWD2_39_7]KKS08968.1 MAG: hypothetical protein UU65_C0003G0023 [candidate division CPR2 bacterium GW2011_GWC1_41_48]OGB58772.1 MAG: hypothetical protein A2Y27_03805 [candidate division CPR2 bacterium G
MGRKVLDIVKPKRGRGDFFVSDKSRADSSLNYDINDNTDTEAKSVKKLNDDKEQKHHNEPIEKELQKKTKIKPKKKRVLIFKVASVFIILLFLVGLPSVTFIYQNAYAGMVMTDAYLLNESLLGKNPEEIRSIINKKIDDFRITIRSGDFEKTYGLKELGIKDNSETVITKAISYGRDSNIFNNHFLAAKEIYKKYVAGDSQDKEKLELKFIVSEDVLEEEISDIFPNLSKGENVVIESVDSIAQSSGLEEDFYKELFAYQLSRGLEKIGKVTGSCGSIDSEFLADVKALVNREIVLKDEDKSMILGPNEIAKFLTFDKDLNPSLDEKKLEVFIQSDIAKKFNVPSEDKKMRVENLSKEIEVTPGKAGWEVDASFLKSKIMGAIEDDEDLIVVKMNQVAPKVVKENVIVPDWNKKIDINLTTQAMTVSVKDGEGYKETASWKVTTGKRSTPTPTGTTYVMNKTPVTRMTGGIPGVDYYDLPNIHWVTYFRDGGYAVHEAYWRRAFGGQDYVWSGSHGCVNAPIDVAKFIYDWAPIGTPVIVHY